jgi:hypothetical protein
MACGQGAGQKVIHIPVNKTAGAGKGAIVSLDLVEPLFISVEKKEK